MSAPPVVILLVDDDAMFRQVMSGALRSLGFDVVAVSTGLEAIHTAPTLSPRVVLLDLQLPDIGGLEVLPRIRAACPHCEVVMLTGHGSFDTAIESVRLGAFDYLAKPCPLDELELRISRALERQALRRRTDVLERGFTPPDLAHAFVGNHPDFRRLLQVIERVAPMDSTVLITGETGSGKEMVAKLLHARSPRRARPFVVVECAALQESLLQSELFGHERGAFTGADRDKPGLFEVANGGTIFLDEIGEVSLATQVKLLRVLDTSTFRHVGGTAEVHVDVRVIAATNRDMAAMVRQGLFREDLYFRLNTIRLEIPSLRERRSDVDALAAHFVALFNERFGFRKRLGDEAMALLRAYDWPGNVREFLHVIESAMVLCEGAEVLPDHLPTPLRTPSQRQAGATAAPGGPLPTLAELERAHIAKVLAVTNGHRGSAARILGISERNLYRRISEYETER